MQNFATMRVVSEIIRPECKITVFYWNNKYLIKLEAGPFEQTFKIDEFDVDSEAEISGIIDEDFIRQALARFSDMSRSLSDAMDEN